MTYYHSGPALVHNYTAEDSQAFLDLGATRADTGLLYRFIVLEEAPNTASAYAPEANIEAATKDAASVRLSLTNAGLRFTTTVNTAEINALVAKYGAENVKVGTLIAPQDILGEDALTIETATKIDVPASVANPFAQNGIKTTYAGSITNIKPQNLTRDFTAVGYVAFFNGAEWVYNYSAGTCTRNVTEIAQAAVDAGEFAEDADALEILQNLGAVVA